MSMKPRLRAFLPAALALSAAACAPASARLRAGAPPLAPAAAQPASLAPLSAGWQAADARALSAPAGLERDPAALAAYLTRGLGSDAEKARAIFRWLAEHVAYDYAALSHPRHVAAADVLVGGRAICDGYASAFELLGRLAGLEVVTIHGWAKGYEWVPGRHFGVANHAWNAVRLDGRWRLVDATWGAGYVRDGRFVKVLDDFFFLPAPEALAFTHLAEDPRWQLTERSPSLARWEAQPVARSAFFRAGFSAADARAALATPAAQALVEVFLEPEESLRVAAAPAGHDLAVGRSYRFELRAPAGSTVALVNAGRWQYLRGDAGVYAGSIAPGPGELVLAVRPAAGGRFRTLLQYRAR